MVNSITSRDNPRIREYVQLSLQKKARTRAGRFVLEGVKLLEEACFSGIEIESVILPLNVWKAEKVSWLC